MSSPSAAPDVPPGTLGPAAAGRRPWLPPLAGYLVFAAIWLALRLPWLTADGGVPSLWEYGFNATDEGYYLYGGKAKYLWGSFVTLVGPEAFTYGHSALTHVLAYLGHLLFGLSSWAWRIPFVAVNFAAWSALYFHVARRARPAVALLLCAACSLAPPVVAFERVAANDVLVASLIVLAYVVSAGRDLWRLPAAAALAAAVALVKPTVWLALPIVLAGVVQTRKTGSLAKDVCLFLGVFALAFAGWKLVALLAVATDAQAAGVSAAELVRRTTTFGPMIPKMFPLSAHLKALSAFPRDPGSAALGVLAVLFTACPLHFGLRRALRRQFDGPTLLFFAVPAYAAGVMLVNNVYTHYFLPAVMLLPAVFAADADDAAPARGGWALTLAWLAPILMAALLLGGWMLFGPAADAAPYYSRIYNTLFRSMPQRNVWGLTAPFVLFFAFAATAIALLLRRLSVPRTPSPRRHLHLLAFLLPAAVGFSVVFAAAPACLLPDVTVWRSASVYGAAAFVSALALSAFLFGQARGAVAPIRQAVFVCGAVGACLLTPVWRSAAAELLAPGTRVKARTAAEIARIVPANALVVGERANDLLMSVPLRTATTFPTAGDPTPVLDAARARNAQTPLYALLPMNPQNLNYRSFLEKRKYGLVKIKSFPLPAFKDGRSEETWLCRVVPLPESSR